MYKLSFKSSVVKDLKRLDKTEIKNILGKIDERILPNPLDGKPLHGEFRGCYRRRFGDYRVIYTVVGTEVLVLRIENRKDVYL